MPGQGRKQCFRFLGIDRIGLVCNRQPELGDPFLDLLRPEEEDAEVEADDRRLRELARERPEPPERTYRLPLREGADRRERERHRVARGKPRRRRELPFGGHPPPELPERY